MKSKSSKMVTKRIMSMILSFVMVFSLMNGLVLVEKAEANEGGSNLSNAESVKIGNQIKGKISDYNVYYKFNVLKDSVVNIKAKTADSNQHIYVTLLDSKGNCVLFLVTDDDKNWGYQKVSETIGLNAGAYYLEIEDASNYFVCDDSPTYTINLSYRKKSSSKLKIAGPKNENLKKAHKMKVGNILYSRLSGPHMGNHYYRFKLNKRRRIQLSCYLKGGDLAFELLNRRGDTIDVGYCYSNSGETVWKYTGKLKKGTYYIVVETQRHYGEYTIKTTYK